VSWREIADALIPSDVAAIIVVVLMLLLWLLRRTGLVGEVRVQHELVAALSASGWFMLAALYLEHPPREILVLGLLIVLGIMRWNTPALKAKKR